MVVAHMVHAGQITEWRRLDSCGSDYDAVRFGDKMSSDVPMKEQERAWIYPIWYTPGH